MSRQLGRLLGRQLSHSLGRIALAALLASSAACQRSERPPAPAPTDGVPAPLHDGPLTDYVPAPSLRWLLWAAPERIAAVPGVLAALRGLADEAAWERLANHNGFDLRRARESLVAGLGLGTLFIVSMQGEDARVEALFRERLLEGSREARPHPRLTRVEGLLGQTPHALLRAEHQLVAIAERDPALVRIVEGYLLGRFEKTPSALRGAALRAQGDFAAGAPLRFWIPGPLSERSLLLGDLGNVPGATALLGAAELDGGACPCPGGPEPRVRVRLGLAGVWPPQEVSPAPLLDRWTLLAESDLGGLLGLREPLTEPRTEVVETEEGARLELTIDLALEPLARGLAALLSAEIEEIFPLRELRNPGLGAGFEWAPRPAAFR